MKIFFLFPYPLGESPSQRFRFEQYFFLLKKKGVKYYTQSFWDEQSWSILYQPNKKFSKLLGFLRGVVRRVKMLSMLPQMDYVFIHREVTPLGPPFFEWVIGAFMRKKIIYDFDDAIWLPNTSEENKLASLLKWPSKVNNICGWSYKISCGNIYLCDYAYKYNRNVVLNPTTIDTENLHNPVFYSRVGKRPEVVIGWTGSHSTLPYLKLLEGVLQEIEVRHEHVTFMVIADKSPDLQLKRMVFKKWSRETEIADLSLFDIGLMPLPDDIWSRGKCGFKALQYLAMEIPAIVSPVGVNTAIVNHGINGFFASTPEEWKKGIEKLIAEPKLRASMGKEGRITVLQEFSVRSNSDTFLSLFA